MIVFLMEAIVKKIFYVVFAIMPAILLIDIGIAEAKDEPLQQVKESEIIKDKWLEKKLGHINKQYEEAIKNIEQSSFSEKNKKVLLEQAEENRNLAVECAKKRNILRERHRKEREELILQMKQQKENRKAVQNVMNIY